MGDRTSHEIETLTIRMPIRLQRRGGRKLIMTPEGVTAVTPKPRRDDTLIKALVKAQRWRRQIESGQGHSITDLAGQEGVTAGFVCRLLPLSCLAPDIVEAILDGRQPKGLRLAEMLGNGPLAWEEQRGAWGSLGTIHRALSARVLVAAVALGGGSAAGHRGLGGPLGKRYGAVSDRQPDPTAPIWCGRVAAALPIVGGPAGKRMA